MDLEQRWVHTGSLAQPLGCQGPGVGQPRFSGPGVQWEQQAKRPTQQLRSQRAPDAARLLGARLLPKVLPPQACVLALRPVT